MNRGRLLAVSSSVALVGRGVELKTATQQLLDGSVVGSRTLVIEGEAGIGKTTVWLELVAAAAARGMAVLSCRCDETELGLPFTALSDLVAGVPRDLVERLSAPQRRALDIALLRIGVDDGPALELRALGTAMLGLLRAVAATAPVLVAVDDPPWMDPASARALAFAMRRMEGAPVTLLLARRTPSLSVKTVEVNLTRIYRKLEVRSRTDLARGVHDARRRDGPASAAAGQRQPAVRARLAAGSAR